MSTEEKKPNTLTLEDHEKEIFQKLFKIAAKATADSFLSMHKDHDQHPPNRLRDRFERMERGCRKHFTECEKTIACAIACELIAAQFPKLLQDMVAKEVLASITRKVEKG